MSQHSLLNNIEHKDLRVITDAGAQYGDQVMSTPVYPVEVRHVQTYYPILFGKDHTQGQYQMMALFGFEQGENLFLEGKRWSASYKPLLIEKGPFLIGMSNASEQSLSVYIDLDHPRVSQSEGQSIFLPHGGNSDYIDNVANILSSIHQGEEQAKAFIAALESHKLLESFALDMELQDGSTHRLSGLYTIDEDKLAKLDTDSIAQLHQNGYLPLIYMIVASVSNLRTMIDMKNARQNG